MGIMVYSLLWVMQDFFINRNECWRLFCLVSQGQSQGKVGHDAWEVQGLGVSGFGGLGV